MKWQIELNEAVKEMGVVLYIINVDICGFLPPVKASLLGTELMMFKVYVVKWNILKYPHFWKQKHMVCTLVQMLWMAV